jgi:N-acetylneuraminate synthase
LKIGSREIGPGHPCFIVAEIGINHNGDVGLAKQLIDAAIESGADAVKFQKRTVEVVYSEEELARPRDSPWGTTNGDQKRGLEFDREEYAEIDLYCRAEGIPWCASPWDTESVVFLEQFDVPCYKIASACVTDLALLQMIRHTRKPVIMSIGMSTAEELAEAHDLFAWQAYPALLVTTSTYPATIADLHLERIKTLADRYPASVVGYSSHSVSPWPALCAAAMGAKIVEAHLTLDRSLYGSDQASSLEPAAFAKMTQEIRDWEIARGSGEIRLLDCEAAVREKLRRVR